MSGHDAKAAGGPDTRGELLEIVRAARRSLIAQIGGGERGRRRSKKSLSPRSQAVRPKVSRGASGSPDGLAAIREEMENCHRCPLGKGRKNLVFGEGNPHADLVFVGEAPGADEDEKGRPFVGRAGQLLTKIVLAMGLKREDVYICNILKCRPPGNRNPQPDEIAACEPFLIRQLQAISPKFICALGSFAARTLLKTESPITALRGRFQNYHGIRVMPTYHPAYLLRNPDAKKLVWQDVQMIMKELEA